MTNEPASAVDAVGPDQHINCFAHPDYLEARIRAGLPAELVALAAELVALD